MWWPNNLKNWSSQFFEVLDCFTRAMSGLNSHVNAVNKIWPYLAGLPTSKMLVNEIWISTYLDVISGSPSRDYYGFWVVQRGTGQGSYSQTLAEPIPPRGVGGFWQFLWQECYRLPNEDYASADEACSYCTVPRYILRNIEIYTHWTLSIQCSIQPLIK